MGLSAFNAMRAREKAKAEADAKNSASTIKVQETKAPVETSEEKAEENPAVETSETTEKKTYNFQKKKTDAEKLKKKE